MNWDDLLQETIGHARLARLESEATGQVDMGVVEAAVLYVLRDLSARYDFGWLTVRNPTWFVTEPGVDEYELPAGFGRLVNPNDRGEYGVLVNNGTHETGLKYRDPADLVEEQTPTNYQPTDFSILASGRMWLYPKPDSNDDLNYTISGVYISDVRAIDRDGDVPFEPAMANVFISGAVAYMAGVSGAPNAQALASNAATALVQMVGRQARQQVKFQRQAVYSRSRGRRHR